MPFQNVSTFKAKVDQSTNFLGNFEFLSRLSPFSIPTIALIPCWTFRILNSHHSLAVRKTAASFVTVMGSLQIFTDMLIDAGNEAVRIGCFAMFAIGSSTVFYFLEQTHRAPFPSHQAPI